MIQLQRVSGMRPGEVTALRGCDLNMSGELWEYVPESHKSEHHGRERQIVLGKKAQSIIREFLKPNLNAYLFSPTDVREEFDQKRRANRKSPLTPSQKARKRKHSPKRKPGERYTTARPFVRLARRLAICPSSCEMFQRNFRRRNGNH